MTLKEYISDLEKLAKENPETLNMLVVSSSDDEGNVFSPVIYSPTIGFYNYGGFIGSDELNYFGKTEKDINAVCIN